MKRRFATIGLLVTALAALALAGPAQAKDLVPLKAHGTGYATITGTTTGPGGELLVTFNIDGTGQATHLGRYTVEGRDGVVNPDSGAWSGHYTWFAANGDTISTFATGQLVVLPNGDEGWVADYKILGGTGRFENATGWFFQTGVWLDPSTASPRRFTVVWEGEISSVGANKR